MSGGSGNSKELLQQLCWVQFKGRCGCFNFLSGFFWYFMYFYIVCFTFLWICSIFHYCSLPEAFKWDEHVHKVNKYINMYWIYGSLIKYRSALSLNMVSYFYNYTYSSFGGIFPLTIQLYVTDSCRLCNRTWPFNIQSPIPDSPNKVAQS